MEAASHSWVDVEYSRTSLRIPEEYPPVTDRGCSNQELAIGLHFMMKHKNMTVLLLLVN